MVENAVSVYRGGMVLIPPAEVVGATADYRADQDLIGQFFAARVREDRNGKVKASELYATFKTWWEDEGYSANKVPGPTKFGREAKGKFHHFKASGIVYAVRLRDESEREGGKVGGNSPETARAHALGTALTGNVAPAFPPSRGSKLDTKELSDEEFERDGIREFGGG